MKLLHIASFHGNVGDVLSNFGLKSFLDREYGQSVDVDRLEIRRFHKNIPESERLSFDGVLDEAASRYDRVLIGGGGFLDYWVPGSATGATIELSERVLDSIGRKLVISSVGAYPHRPVPAGNLERFAAFLSVLKSRPDVGLMFRNDGSVQHLTRVLGADATAGLRVEGDHCYLLANTFDAPSVNGRPYVAVNVAPDQMEMLSERRSSIDSEHFFKTLAKSLLELAETYSCDIVFVPHLLLDYKAGLTLSSFMPDSFVRSHFRMFQYDGTEANVPQVVSVYGNSLANVVTRLHSNILSLLLNKRTITLGVLDRVAAIADQHEECVLIEALNGDFSEAIARGVARSDPASDPANGMIRGRVETFLRQALEDR